MIETTILSNLLFNEEYVRKVAAYLKPDYFHNPANKVVFGLIKDFIDKYNAIPVKGAIKIMLEKVSVPEQVANEANAIIGQLQVEEGTTLEWLIEVTETFCKDRALHNAILESINIIDDKNKKLAKGSIPQLLSDALAISFDDKIGHDFLDDSQERYHSYFEKEKKIPFDLTIFNQITGGGLAPSTLTVFMAGPGGGKSRMLGCMAGNNLRTGHNTLYISLEMIDVKIAKRIEANLLDIPIKEIEMIGEQGYMGRIADLRRRVSGKLIIKGYPPASANVSTFKHLLNELKLKKGFVPDIIYVDYINLMLSTRIKQITDSYGYIKCISEELRGLAVEMNIPIVTATQINRTGSRSSDPDMADVSESFALTHTADYFFALLKVDKIRMMVKQLKHREGDLSFHERFMIGVDPGKFRLYDILDENGDDDTVLINPQTGEITSNTTPNSNKAVINFDDL